jgi:hypothetical protein
MTAAQSKKLRKIVEDLGKDFFTWIEVKTKKFKGKTLLRIRVPASDLSGPNRQKSSGFPNAVKKAFK